MCGIYAAVTTTGQAPPGLQGHARQCLCRRGPDHEGTVDTQLPGTDVSLTFTSTVLSLRGDVLSAQPLVDDAGSVLCWNGEAWRIRGQSVADDGRGDTQAVMELLTSASASGDEDAVLDALRSIEGPFAVVFFDRPERRLYYARDRLGRRSLLARASDGDSSLVLSSVADADALQQGWAEVEADGCYSIRLDREGLQPTRHSWVDDESLVGSGSRVRAN